MMSDWISVKDKSPNQGDVVPVIIQGIVLYAMWQDNDFVLLSFSNVFQSVMVVGLPEIGSVIDVTHWMPLPELPKEEQKC